MTKKLCTTNESLAAWAICLHQVVIDFGAHPNRDALYSNMEHERGKDGSLTIKMVTLHLWNPFFIGTMKFTVETGIIALSLFALGFPDGLQALNLAQDIIRLKNKLENLLKTTKFE